MHGHAERSRHKNHHLKHIVAQAKADGRELPKVKLAENLTDDEALELEKVFIAAIGREAHGGPLVNLTDGGDGPSGYQPTPELIARQVAARKGWHHTDEMRAQISARFKGIPKTPEHKAKVADAQRGKKKMTGWWSTEEGRAKQKANNPSPFKPGHKHSPETIEKIRAARLRQTNVSTAGYFKRKSPQFQGV